MKILVIAPPPEGRGPVSKFTPILIKELIKKGYIADSLFRKRNDEKTLFLSRVIERIKDFFIIMPHLKKEYDVIVLNTAHDYKTLLRDLPLLFFSFLMGCRMILQFHGSDLSKLNSSLFFRRWTGIELKMGKGALLLSTEELCVWQKYWPDINFQVVHNPLPPMPPYETKGIRDRSEPVFLFAGRIIKEKGVFELAKAFSKVVTKKKCSLIIAGDGLELPKLRDTIKELCIDNYVTFTGHVTGDGLWKLYQQADAFVFPSFSEGQPTVLMEAAHFGLPIIATNIRAVKDIFQDGVNGYFIPLHRPDLLEKKMLQLLTEPEVSERMKAANLQLINRFNADAIVSRYLAALKKLK